MKSNHLWGILLCLVGILHEFIENLLNYNFLFPFPQVAAQTGHNVTMVDMNEDILAKSTAHIQKSLSRVVKKQFKDDQAVSLLYIRSGNSLYCF